MKKLSILFAMIFAVSMAMAQTSVDLDQTGGGTTWPATLINNASIQQVGTDVTADFDQTAGTWNYLRSGQNGTNLSIRYEATAGGKNTVGGTQSNGFLQDGSNGDIDIQQVATNGDNHTQTWQQSGLGYTANNNDIDVIQTAGTSNTLIQRQSGQNHVVNLEQTAATSNSAETYQGQWGALETDNILVGAELGTNGPLYDEDGPATQTSASSYNELFLDQNGSFNKVGLSQNGYDYNYANIYQDGGENSLLIHQNNADGFNSVMSSQMGGANSASVLQNTVAGSGTINVNQN
jgi:hypothetical protein